MNYKVSRIRRAGPRWKADVTYWEGSCSCTGKTKEVDIEQDKRPTNKDVLAVFSKVPNY